MCVFRTLLRYYRPVFGVMPRSRKSQATISTERKKNEIYVVCCIKFTHSFSSVSVHSLNFRLQPSAVSRIQRVRSFFFVIFRNIFCRKSHTAVLLPASKLTIECIILKFARAIFNAKE